MIEPRKPKGGHKSLFLFDAYNFIFRAYHALPMLNAPDGTPVNAVHGFVRMLQAVRREFAPQYVVAVFDAGGDGRRKEVFPEYKAQRPPPPEDLRPQFGLVRDATDAMGVPRVEHPDFEADDVIAAYAKEAREQGINVVIVSSDKDLMQLCTEGEGASCLLFDTMKNRAIGPPEVQERFGVGPQLLGDLLALTGDTSDNIPGVPGIGPKTAAALLTEHGDLEGVLAAADGIKQKKRRERLLEHADDARVSRELVALHDEAPLPIPISELEDHGPDDARLVAFFEPLGFKQVLREMGAAATATKRAAGTPKPAPVDDDTAIELLPVADFTAAPATYRTLMAGDEAALTEVGARVADAAVVALYLPIDGDDPLAASPVGIAVACEGVPPTYLPIAHAQLDLVAGRQLTAEAVVEALRPGLEDAERPKIVHNAKATSHALATLGVQLRGIVADPMLASYTLDPARSSHALSALAGDVLGATLQTQEQLLGKGRKRLKLPEQAPDRVGAFASERAEASLGLGRALRRQVDDSPEALRKLLREVEMPLSDVLTRLERRGIAVDTDELTRQSDELGDLIAQIQARVDEEAGHAVNIGSTQQLQQLLYDERGLPAVRKTKTGYSTDARALEELALLDPIVRDILQWRSVTKLKGTYLDALPKLVNEETGRLHTSFHQAVAATGRLSSSDPNLQNIPIRTTEGRRIREAFVAPPGQCLVALDYSQIELRVLAHLCGDPNLMSAFIEGVDVHRRTAAEVFGVAEADVTDEQRRIAKAVNFGVIYGQTAFGLAQQLGIPRGKAGSYIRAYFEKVPGVDQYMKQLIDDAKHRGFAETIMGRRRRIPELRRKGPARGHGERIARNTPIQGSAADILKVAMIEVDKALQSRPWARMLLTVHDELIFECEEDRTEELIDLCRPMMESAAKLSVPLQVDAGFGKTWAACKG